MSEVRAGSSEVRATATDELRRLLDERGVEWWEEDGHTLWYGESIHHAASAFSSFMFGENERVHLNAMVTPEQAVAATLGPGTCMDVAEFRGFGTKTEFRCSECGYEYSAVGGFGCDYGDEPDFRYCPNCGRRVVE